MTTEQPMVTMESVSAALGLKNLMRLKYVILSVNDIPTPVVFPAHLQHDAMVPSGACGGQLIHRVISAGFCEVVHSERGYRMAIRVGGASQSLQVSSRPEDSEIVAQLFR